MQKARPSGDADSLVIAGSEPRSWAGRLPSIPWTIGSWNWRTLPLHPHLQLQSFQILLLTALNALATGSSPQTHGFPELQISSQAHIHCRERACFCGRIEAQAWTGRVGVGFCRNHPQDRLELQAGTGLWMSVGVRSRRYYDLSLAP